MKIAIYTLGVTNGILLTTLYFFLPTFFEALKQPQEQQKPQSTFEVIDNYKGCDIVKMQNPTYSDYKFFMRCPK